MIHNQSLVPACNIPRSVFDLSYRHLTTFDSDFLIPFFHSSVLPGDTFNLNTNLFVRFNNIVHPIMDNLYLDTFFFFVPYRLIWDNWEKFCGYQENPGDSTDYLIPQMKIKALPQLYAERLDIDDSSGSTQYFGYVSSTGYSVVSSSNQDEIERYCYECSLKDYFGIPLSAHRVYSHSSVLLADGSVYTGSGLTNQGWLPLLTDSVIRAAYTDQLTDQQVQSVREDYFLKQGKMYPVKSFVEDQMVNSFNFRAYNLIWNEWFRDENLQDSVNVPKDDGPDDAADFVLLKRGKRHDYFTSCLPWPQKGPAVMLPLGENAPVFSNTSPTVDSSELTPIRFYNTSGALFPSDSIYPYVAGISPGSSAGVGSLMGVGSVGSNVAARMSLYADLSAVTGISVNQLRDSVAVQRFYEKCARGGTRYFELLQSMFGVYNPDLRLQRPQYLGGSSQPLNIIPVVQTSASTDQSPQGNLSAMSVSSVRCGFTQSFGEFGVVIGLLSVRSDLTYQQGLSRFYTKRTLLDLYWPTFAFLGEQAVLQQEIYLTGDAEQDQSVFGYQERWAEYRYSPSRISGYMNSNSPTSLDVWHLGQRFDNAPKLNSSFIQEAVPIGRVRMDDDQPAFMCDVYNKFHATRPLPTYSVPGLMDHF